VIVYKYKKEVSMKDRELDKYWDEFCERQEKIEAEMKEDENNYKTCEICGEKFYIYDDEKDIEYGVCTECKKKICNAKTALKIGEDLKYDVKVNGFIAFFYSEEEINEILLNKYNEDKAQYVVDYTAEEMFEHDKEDYIDKASFLS
jgi:hypothetical protein